MGDRHRDNRHSKFALALAILAIAISITTPVALLLYGAAQLFTVHP